MPELFTSVPPDLMVLLERAVAKRGRTWSDTHVARIAKEASEIDWCCDQCEEWKRRREQANV